MENLYDSGLFSELGDLLGHDTGFYEESDVSSYAGDISKQVFHNTLSPNNLDRKTKMSSNETGRFHIYVTNFIFSIDVIENFVAHVAMATNNNIS